MIQKGSKSSNISLKFLIYNFKKRIPTPVFTCPIFKWFLMGVKYITFTCGTKEGVVVTCSDGTISDWKWLENRLISWGFADIEHTPETNSFGTQDVDLIK